MRDLARKRRPLRRFHLLLQLALRRSSAVQVLLIVALWALALLPVQRWQLPVPAGVIGMAVLLLLLATGVLRSTSVSRGSGWLLGQMLLFFVPAVMVVMDMPALLGPLGLKLMIATLIGTALVMLTTALVVMLGLRWMGTDER